MGLIVYIYRDRQLGDCTNGGISATADRLTLVNVPGPSEPDETAPAAILESHAPGCLRIVPQELKDLGAWPMMGGNFAHTSDSRFAGACERLLGHWFYGAVAIHDRTENTTGAG